MESGFPPQPGPRQVEPGPEPLGPRALCVQSIYDFKVYQAKPGEFIAIDKRNGQGMGPFATQSAAVKAVVNLYFGQAQAPAANPHLKPMHRSKPLGFFTSRGTSL